MEDSFPYKDTMYGHEKKESVMKYMNDSGIFRKE